jgi:hypothetical protein
MEMSKLSKIAAFKACTNTGDETDCGGFGQTFLGPFLPIIIPWVVWLVRFACTNTGDETDCGEF